MNAQLFITNFIDNINEVQYDEFKIHNFTYNEKQSIKKTVNDNLMDFRNFKSSLIKRSIKDKTKPSFINKNEIEVESSGLINILEDDIFQNDEQKQEDNKLNIDNVSNDIKKELIMNYLYRKNIKLTEEQINNINGLFDNPDFNIKKYITISKTNHQISKITFLKKQEDGTYILDFREKQKIKKNFFK